MPRSHRRPGTRRLVAATAIAAAAIGIAVLVAVSRMTAWPTALQAASTSSVDVITLFDSAAACDPENGGCLHVTLHQTPRLRPLAASGEWVAAALLDGQNTRAGVRLYWAGSDGFLAAGAIPLPESALALSGDLLYAVEDERLLHIWNLADPLRPALVEQMDAGEAGAGDMLLHGAALFLAHSHANGGLSVYSLVDPRHPTLARQLDSDPFLRMALDGKHLVAATSRGLAVADVEDPLAPNLLSSRTWLTGVLTTTIDLHVERGVAYLMAESAADAAPVCRIVRIDAAGEQHAAGDCPFPPGRTAFLGGRAWVNPNQSSAQYLDYRRYTLANPLTPLLEGVETMRFAHAVASRGNLYASALDGRLLRLRPASDGHLEIVTTTWDARELEVKPVAFVGEALIVDAGIQAGSERALRFVSLTDPSAPVVRGELRSPWISATGLRARDGQLATLRASHITLFDVRNPDAPAALGQFALPAGVVAADIAWGSGPRLHVLGGGNRLFTIDVTNPLTPTLDSSIDLPGNAEQLLAVQGALYLFEPGEMTVLETSAADAPRFVKRIPGVPLPEAATTFGDAAYLLAEGGVQVLDVRDPLNPLPAASQSPFDSAPAPVADLLPVQDGLLVSVERETSAAATGREAGATSWLARIYALDEPLHPREVAAVGGLTSAQLVFGNGMLVLPNLTTYKLGPERRVTARVPAAGGAHFSPEAHITYEFLEGTFDPGVGHSASAPGELCIEEYTRPAPAFSPGEPVVYGAVRELRVFDCETGQSRIPRLPVRVTVVKGASVSTESAGGWPEWEGAQLRLDAGDAWEVWPGAANSANTLSGELLPLRAWAVVGPPPPPHYLPAIRRSP